MIAHPVLSGVRGTLSMVGETIEVCSGLELMPELSLQLFLGHICN
jgi:hypothetical protein